MKRVDAYLSSLGYCTRSEARKFLKMNSVFINENRVFNPSLKAKHNEISVNDEKLDSEKITILMNKPSNVICSHNDSGKLIYSLLPQRYQNRNPKISTIGRLDIDTTGAILLTDDGELNHKLTSPKKDVKKIYEVTLQNSLKGDEKEIFESGIVVLNGEDKPLKPAKLKVINDNLVHLEIVEGKYHQVKRMFAYTKNRVIKLHRLEFAGFRVDDLKEGEFRVIEYKS
ncbi:16S rRNA pseudouridine(516) synthase [Aliarcobacter cryaerophilus ATCC 43158]|uniref:Pseudouridine synthase n=1 Tax=Aliarcobacter cryaerophilus ATCC 43158 TaxID=1032070 RepID=A0AAD0TTL6_9BACT|nr:pseudouridine synthase [Aliarcobacter cryaerophilus]AYJ80060.1 RsuA-like pseudouridine synthase [Aliarcobacter cryaerophilus ATCC 43158]PRM97674.1 16S rRNA pseudouridine(516) synthase [Aliarcobacter cryaerophilus]QCZ24285.1 16S rRNA pseudouridine(516) synthase [Aliarcobacter cryaerophilus ATCC 43158]